MAALGADELVDVFASKMLVILLQPLDLVVLNLLLFQFFPADCTSCVVRHGG